MTEQIEVGSDFSGVGSFDQALRRLNIRYKTIFSCDVDKYARQSYVANYGQPSYFPYDVYERLIPESPLDIYMTSPPCQSFSLAGKRKGEDDKRGILFYNSHEFITKNKPRYFIIENVKGLLSDNDGNTFSNWINLLGGKSVNGNPVMFPLNESTPYHIYHTVLNAKHYGVPQNRERVFIVGIRDDSDNTFTWPKKQHLTKRLKDVLESHVDEKYFLSDKMIDTLTSKNDQDNGFTFKPKEGKDTGNCVTARCFKMKADDNYIKVKSATNKGFEEATIGDSINLQQLDSKTRRGRVGKQVAQTLDTSCNQCVLIAHVSRSEEGKKERKKSMAKGKDYTPFQAKDITFKESDVMNCITTTTAKDNLIKIGAIRGRGDDNKQQLELNENDTSNAITTVQKDNVVVTKNYLQFDTSGKGYASQSDRVHYQDGVMCTIPTETGKANVLINDYQIRRLTPRECFRLMDFPEDFKFVVSDTQLYRQAGNSIVVSVLASIIEKLNLT